MWTGMRCFKEGEYAFLAYIFIFNCVTLRTVNAQCAGVTREIAVNGVLSSPNYPANYPAGSSCSWRLIASDSTTGIITITFHFFNLYPTGGTNVVYLYDDFTSSTKLIATLTGSRSQFSHSSTQQYMFVRFLGPNGYPGFNASFISTSRGCVAATRPQILTGLVTGTLSSPSYPGNYYDDSICYWRFTSILSTGIIMITFTDFFTDPCCDFVNIYDGMGDNATQLAKLSGSRPVPIVYSTTQRDMFVTFISDGTLNNKGYTAIFVSTSVGCSPTSRPRYMEANGTLITPNYPSNYHNDGDCQWRISATPSTGVVMLTFHSFNTENCCDFVNIYDGSSIGSPLIATLNGSLTVPFVIAGTQREMYIQFSTDANGTNSGFTADVVTTSFGCTPTTRPRSLSGSGVISSPNYPSDYHNDGDCQWLLTANDSDGLVEITFSNFTTESCCDKVFIYDGNNGSSQLIASFSGTPETPLVYSTSQQYMLVRFEADTTTTASGFNATFRTLDRGCTSGYQPRRLTGSGSLTSPDYPGNYPNNQDCQWLMSSATEEGEVTLTITSFSTELLNDYLELYDGTSTSSPLIATLSGSISAPRIYLTTSPYLFLKFVSDSVTTNGGFTATFTSTEIEECLSTPCQNGATCIDGINSFYCNCPLGYTGTLCETVDDECISSPCLNDATCINIGSGYNCSCIVGFTGTLCETNINECVSSPCRNGASCIDEVNGYTCNCLAGFTGTRCDSGIDECESSPCVNGGTCVDRINGFLCVCPPEWGGVRCDNDTDNCISSPCLNGATCISEANGFRCQCLSDYTGLRCESAELRTTTSVVPIGGSACSAGSRPQELTGYSGTFSSENYPQDYDDNANCQWKLAAVQSDGIVELTFTDFSIEACCDSVRLFDGDSKTAPVIATLAGTTGAGVQYNSTQQYMLIIFTTDDSITDRGFNATFITHGTSDPCSPDTRPLQLMGSGSLTSWNYPSAYDDNADCQWLLISSNADWFVELNFDDFSTETCCDVVSVYDGTTSKSKLITSISGELTPPPKGLTTTQQYMFVRFASDDSINDIGFSATFTSINSVTPTPIGDPCSPETRPLELTGSGSLTSANFPLNYDNDADCQWLLISSDVSQIVQLDFEVFSTEECCDTVKIYDGTTAKSKLIDTLAGNITSPPKGLITTQRYMFVKFFADESDNAGGFRATFTSVIAA